MKRWACTLSLALALSLGGQHLCHAQEAPDRATLLEQGIEAFLDLRVEDALELFTQAEAAGGLPDDQLARLHLYRGLSMASLGHDPDSVVSFRRALDLSIDIQLPPDTSPVVTERFEALREQIRAESATSTDGSESSDVVVPQPQPEPRPPPPPSKPVISWVLLGFTGATFLGGTTSLILALVTRANAQNDARLQDEADEMLDAYRLETRLAFAFFSVSAALLATTLVTWFGERSRREGRERSPRVSFVPSPGGVALSGIWGG